MRSADKPPEQQATAIVWFRSDLRIDDNPALNAAIDHAAQQPNPSEPPLRGIYIATPKQWSAQDMSPIQADFIERHLNQLAQQLASRGIPLDFLVADDYADQQQQLLDYSHQHHHAPVFANIEVGFNENQRDQQLIKQGLSLRLTEADVIAPRGTVLTGSQQMYKVFTPFKKAWLTYMTSTGLMSADSFPNATALATNIATTANIATATATTIALPYPKRNSQQWPLAEQFSQQQLPAFLTEQLADYHQYRDIPSHEGTSGLSPYLTIGAISVRQLMRHLLNRHPDLLEATSQPLFAWLNELIWRDFYRHLMAYFPQLSRHQTFKPQYQQLLWSTDEVAFQAWCQGRTGYPIVDAAMLQLRQTGWMHNRLRMIVASFLTKHLLIDWRRGEQFFMQHLIDGDLAANNGGWQWSAGTGCDAQPYFRIFNPITQSQRFDPKGLFIRRYIPQLAQVPDKHIHFPHQWLAQQQQTDYWPAIVDHKTARLDALAFYKQSLGK